MKIPLFLIVFRDITQILLVGLRFAFIPTLVDVIRNPLLIFNLSRTYMVHLWGAFSDGVDQKTRPMKERLLPHAQGVVLDIGAGYGHTIRYLDREKVSRYIALEPSTRMHAKIRQVANEFGFSEADGSLKILGHGAEDITALLEGTDGPVDTIISVLTLCSLPKPKRVLTQLVRDVIKPGGQLIFFEHVLNPRDEMAWWQWFYAPVWSVFYDGCRLNQATDQWVEEMAVEDGQGRKVCIWKEGKCFPDPTQPTAAEAFIWHVGGRFIKKDD